MSSLEFVVTPKKLIWKTSLTNWIFLPESLSPPPALGRRENDPRKYLDANSSRNVLPLPFGVGAGDLLHFPPQMHVHLRKRNADPVLIKRRFDALEEQFVSRPKMLVGGYEADGEVDGAIG